MKRRYTYLLLASSFLLLNSCVKTRIAGTWKTKEVTEQPSAEFTFQPNGTLQYKTTNDEIQLESWEYSKKRKQLTVSSTNSAKSKKYTIHTFTGLYMVMSSEEEYYTLSRQLKIKSFNYNKATQKIRGEWNLVQLGTENQNVAPSSNQLRITFWNNGTYQQNISGNIVLGKWVLSNDAKTLSLGSETGTEEYTINFLKNGKIELIDQYGSYFFDKKARTPKAPANKKIERQIVGAWTIEDIGKKQLSLDYTMYLNSDGSLQVFEDQNITKSGRWYVTEDSNLLILEHNEGQEIYPIEKIKFKRLKIRDEFQSIWLKKVSKL